MLHVAAALGVPLERQHRGSQNKRAASRKVIGLKPTRGREIVEGQVVRRRGYAIGEVEAGRPRLKVTGQDAHRLRAAVVDNLASNSWTALR